MAGEEEKGEKIGRGWGGRGGGEKEEGEEEAMQKHWAERHRNVLTKTPTLHRGECCSSCKGFISYGDWRIGHTWERRTLIHETYLDVIGYKTQ